VAGARWVLRLATTAVQATICYKRVSSQSGPSVYHPMMIR
jgi:hypothetical protein